MQVFHRRTAVAPRAVASIHLRALWPLVATVAGCASVASGTTQLVSITAVCEGVIVSDVACILSNDKGQWDVKTGQAIEIRKSYSDLRVTCTKGPATGKASFVSKPNGGAWGNIIAGGVIGYAVDSSSGAGFNYPLVLPVVLYGECPASSDAKSTEKKE
jgi:hypothetical protein